MYVHLTILSGKDIGGIFLSLQFKNDPSCDREQPKKFIQQSSSNIMDVLHHYRYGCYAIYDKDFIRQDESGGFWGGNGQNLDESGGFGAKIGQNLVFLQS